MSDAPAKQRLDKWLWYARFFKTRSLAARQISDGHVRVDSVRVTKPAQTVSAGAVLTFPQGRTVRVVQVDDVGQRRGPAAEAQTLYTDLTPPAEPVPPRVGERPTKKDRRALDALQGRSGED